MSSASARCATARQRRTWPGCRWPASGATPGALGHAEAYRHRFVQDLAELVRIPSVGSDPSRAGDTRRCAAWLAAHLRAMGLPRSGLLPTAGHPLVWGESRRLPGRPVVLLYGHYDVQPPGPRSAWHTPPFEPTVRGAFLHGRGASDDKGQLLAQLKGLESWLRTGGPPVQVKVLLEGEEEHGSPSLAAALDRYRSLLAADVALVSDSPMIAPGRPAITSSLRGSLGLDLVVRTAAADLHSGIFGGAAPDAIQVLCRLVASLSDEAGRPTVAGLEARVRQVPLRERRALAAVAPSPAGLLRDAGARALWGDPRFTPFERTALRPALSVTAIRGGHQGPGDRTAIAASARARLNVRLAPDQEPEEVTRALARHLARRVPGFARASLQVGRHTRPYRVDLRRPLVRAAARACARGFGVRPVLLPSGGSIAAVPLLERVLGVPSVLVGFALPGDGKHGPDERFHLPTFHRAVATTVLFLDEAARAGGGPAPAPPPEAT